LLHPEKIVYYGSNGASAMFWFRDPSMPYGEYVDALYNVCFNLGDLGQTDAYLSELCKDKSLSFVDAKSHIAGPDVFNAGQRFLDRLCCFRPDDYELKNVNMSHGFPTQVKEALGWTLNDLHMHAFHKKENNEDDTAPVYWFSPCICWNGYSKNSINRGDYLRASCTRGDSLDICFVTMPFGFTSQEARDDTTKEIMSKVSDYTNI
jgi:hypothetical protein